MTSRTSLLALSAVLVGLVLVSYAPVYRAQFIDFDDADYVTENEHIYTGLSGDNLEWAFTHHYSSNWHPLTWISHMLDVELFGPMQAGGHHAVNVALHALNVVLLFLLLAWLTGDMGPSFVVALLFAIHPVNVESVAWVAQRKTTLSTFFGILAIGSYALYARRADRRWYAVSVLLFALSLMSKQMLVTLPMALLLLDYWPIGRTELGGPIQNPKKPGKSRSDKSTKSVADRSEPRTYRQLLPGFWRLIPEKLPYLALTVAMSIVTLIVQQGSIRSVESYPVSARLANVSIAYVRYLVSFAWPQHLAIFYPLDQSALTPLKVLGSLALLLAISAACLKWGLRKRYLLVGWFWYLGTLVPVIGLVHVGLQSMADRYAYVPFWGLAFIAAWGARDLLAWLQMSVSARRWLSGSAIVILAALLAGLTYQQAQKWHDSITLFEDALADTEHNWLAHSQLAKHYMGQGDLKQAIEHSERSLAADHKLGEVYGTYGLALFQSGQHQRALEAFEKAIQANPASTWGYTNLGWANSELKNYDKAIELLAEAAKRIRPTDTRNSRVTIYANWGNALRKLNRMSEAREKYNQALAIDPNAGFLLRDAASVDLALGEPDAAIRRLNQGLALNANDVETLQLLAQVLRAQGKLPDAAATLERILSLPGSHLDSAMQLAQVLAQLKRYDEAQRLLQKILISSEKATTQNAKVVTSTVRVQLAALAVAQQQRELAIQHFDAALAAWPDNPAALNNLAWLLATDRVASSRDAQRALELAERNLKVSGADNINALGTLAAAQASAGQMDAAIATVRRALERTQQTHQSEAVPGLNRQLQAYERGEIYRGN